MVYGSRICRSLEGEGALVGVVVREFWGLVCLGVCGIWGGGQMSVGSRRCRESMWCREVWGLGSVGVKGIHGILEFRDVQGVWCFGVWGPMGCGSLGGMKEVQVVWRSFIAQQDTFSIFLL